MLKRKNKNIFWIVFIGVNLFGIYNMPIGRQEITTGRPSGVEVSIPITITVLGPIQDTIENIVTAVEEPIMESPAGSYIDTISEKTGILQNNIILTIIILITSLLVIYIINKKY